MITCKTCRYHHEGRCRRRSPPNSYLEHYLTNKPSRLVTNWPEVAPEDWCGEYEKRDAGEDGK